jgi:hypothetical protein
MFGGLHLIGYIKAQSISVNKLTCLLRPTAILIQGIGIGGDITDTPTDILPEGSARCVQSFDDSLDFAIRITYRISLRSSSIWEPRHPLLKVLGHFVDFQSSNPPKQTKTL